MSLPFTPDEFLDVFAVYNQMLWPFALGLWLLTAYALIMPGAHATRSWLVRPLLAFHWAWSGAVYHAGFFAAINPAAWVVGAAFLLEAALLLRYGLVPPRPEASPGPAGRYVVSKALIAYALLYPAIAIAEGHPYPGVPTFGVPCPTTILTIGVLLAHDSVPRRIAVIPLAWAFIGGSAAFELGMRVDLMLLAAGIILAVEMFRPRSDRRVLALAHPENSPPMVNSSISGRGFVGKRPMRPSLHLEPTGALAIARHYIRDVVYGANDGLITTFAVVAGVTGGGLSAQSMLIIGAANLFADGLSMGVGNYLSIRSNESALAAQNRPEEEASPARHGLATLLAFVLAGAVPLAPFALGVSVHGLVWSVALTFAMLFGIGASRALVTVDRWWVAGLEMLLLGVAVAGAAYGSGSLVARLITSGVN